MISRKEAIDLKVAPHFFLESLDSSTAPLSARQLHSAVVDTPVAARLLEPHLDVGASVKAEIVSNLPFQKCCRTQQQPRATGSGAYDWTLMQYDQYACFGLFKYEIVLQWNRIRPIFWVFSSVWVIELSLPVNLRGHLESQDKSVWPQKWSCPDTFMQNCC